jgi:cation diffusion facilitator family transporter
MPHYNWTDDGYFVTERRDLGQIRRVLIVTMLLNFLATAIKIGAGLLTGALSVVADGLDSLFDGLSNVVGLAGLYASSKPPDAEHPYGHRKFETVAALSISFLLFLTCWQLIQVAWSRLGEAHMPSINLWIVAAMLLSMVVQAGTSFYELREGRRLKSELLVADALHTRASILVSLSVLVGLGLVRLGFPQADPILAGVVALVIARIGFDILKETLPVLVDQAVVDPQKIAEVVRSVEGVESFHRVRSRGAEGSALVDLHVRISPNKTVQDADAIASEIRRRLLALEKVTDVTVHLEAQHSPETDGADIFATLKHIADELGVTIHESWAYRTGGQLFVEVHVGVNPRLTLGEAHALVDRLERELVVRAPEVTGVHTHIEMAELQVQEGDRATAELEQRVRSEVEQVVASLPGLGKAYNITVRHNRGDGRQYYISLDCSIASETPVGQAHRLSHLLEQELRRRLKGVVDVFVHLEPEGPHGENKLG